MLGDLGVTDVTEALSLKHNLAHVDIYTNSWGPSDGFGYARPGSVTESAFYDGVTKVFNMVSCGMNKWFHYLIHHFLLVKTNSSIKIQININQMVRLWYEQLVL